jgi:hypothetical protein
MLQQAVDAMKHEVVRVLIDGAEAARNSCLVTMSAIVLTKPHQKEIASARKSKPEKTSHDNHRENAGSRADECPKKNQQAHHDGQREAQHRPLVAIFGKPAHLISAHQRLHRKISRKAKGFFWALAAWLGRSSAARAGNCDYDYVTERAEIERAGTTPASSMV